MAKELAELRGSTLTDAVTSALGESLRARRPARADVDALLAEVRQVQSLVAELPDQDRRSPDEILGYDELGLPV